MWCLLDDWPSLGLAWTRPGADIKHNDVRLAYCMECEKKNTQSLNDMNDNNYVYVLGILVHVCFRLKSRSISTG